jgi:DNA ligase-1
MLKHGIYNLPENCRLQPGVPLKPMLAKPTKSITEVLDRFDGKDFTCEYKYDGERAQIHFVSHDADQELATTAPSAGKSERGVSNIFSRNSEDLSKKYPDILAKLPTWVKEGTQSFVLDCETVAWDMEEKKVLPFQQLMTRKRKDVKVEDVKVKVCVFAFDILYLNGEVCIPTPIPPLSTNEVRLWSTNPFASAASISSALSTLLKASSHSPNLATRTSSTRSRSSSKIPSSQAARA